MSTATYPHRSQQGVALLTALLITALCAVIASGIALSNRHWLVQATHGTHTDQAIEYALGAESLARLGLFHDAQANAYDGPTDHWAISLPPLPIEGGQVQGRVLPLDGRLNLNGLLIDNRINALQLTRMQRLFRHADINPAILDAILDWLDDDAEVRTPGGAEDVSYASASPPYRAANQPFSHLSELRLIAGVDEPTFNALSRVVSVLPHNALLNINVAPDAVIASLADNLSPSAVAGALDRRREQPFDSLNAFAQLAIFDGLELNTTGLSVKSQWFVIHTAVILGDTRLALLSYLRRDHNGRSSVLARERHYSGLSMMPLDDPLLGPHDG